MGEKEAVFLVASAAGGMSERVPLTVFMGAGNDGSTVSSRSYFLQEHAGGGVEELSQHSLNIPDAGIDGGQYCGENQA